MAREQNHNDVERQLRGYFDAQREELKAPSDMWSRISGELGEQTSSPWWRRIDVGSWLRTVQPAYAGAVAVIAVAVVGVVTYSSFVGDSASDATFSTAAVMESDATAPQAAPLAPEANKFASPSAADSTMSSAAPAPMVAAAGESVTEPTGSGMGITSFAAPEVFLEPLIDVTLSGQRLFSINLPPGWAVGGPRAAATGWEGTLVGDGFFLSYQGGTSVVNDISDVLGSAGNLHVIIEETIGGYAAQLVQPIGDAEGVTAILLVLPQGRMLVIGQSLSVEEQRVAFAIFRSIQPQG
jgi:hypothetical protein